MMPLVLIRTSRPVARAPFKLLLGVLPAVLLAVLAPAGANASITVVGSPLSAPATLNTSENLNYVGTFTQVPPNREAPDGIFHTFHYGADTAVWNVALANGAASMPATGQAVKVSLEGCAQSAPGGPSPLTQIHFQDVTPLGEGGARVNLSSQAFDIPQCGQNGASGSTVSTYEPVNLCVSQGDYVAFNDEGGYVENIYRNGVSYQVLGVAQGSASDSFIRSNGTGNGAMLSASDRSANDGFASNQNEELMLQVTLGTGPNATHICAGGTAGLAPVLPPIRVSPQTDGVNHERIVAVAVYCRLMPECKGVVTLSVAGKLVSVGGSSFTLRGGRTSHLPIRLSPRLMAKIRAHHGVTTTLTAVVGGQTITQTIAVKIL
jgi:hypothetical protein